LIKKEEMTKARFYSKRIESYLGGEGRMKMKGREEAKKNISRKALSVAMSAVLVSSVVIAFMPLAAADKSDGGAISK